MGAVDIANWVQAVATLAVNGPDPEDVNLVGSAGVRGFRRDGVGEYTLLLNQPADVRVTTLPLPKYHAALSVNDLRPLASGSVRALFVPVDVPESPTDTPGSVKIFAYDAAGVAADSLFASVIVYQLPQQE